MAEELFIPKLGQTVEEVTIVDWLAEEGVKIEAGLPVMEVETDKAVFPLEAPVSGFLHKGPFKAGDVVPVLTVVGIIGKKEEKFNPKQDSSPNPQPPLPQPDPDLLRNSITDKPSSPFISPRARKLIDEKGLEPNHITPSGFGGIRIVERDVLAYLDHASVTTLRVSPVAQNVAANAGIDLSSVVGTGLRGMVTKSDVVDAINKAKSPTVGPVENKEAEASTPSNGITNRVPIKGVKGIIFDRMGASVHRTARVTLMMEVDATAFVQAREQLKVKVSEAWGFTPGYNDLLALIVAKALSEHPYLNARISSDNKEIEWLSEVNLGMAVDTERGLLVPVIRNANHKGLKQIGKESRALIERARNGKSLPDDLSGGTFTITNLGMYEVDAFTPVINLPEVAILGVGRIAPKVVAFEGQPVIRQMWTLSLVFDHRVVDGAPAAKFLQRIKHLIEAPLLLLE